VLLEASLNGGWLDNLEQVLLGVAVFSGRISFKTEELLFGKDKISPLGARRGNHILNRSTEISNTIRMSRNFAQDMLVSS